jgi:hypothetical protein
MAIMATTENWRGDGGKKKKKKKKPKFKIATAYILFSTSVEILIN